MTTTIYDIYSKRVMKCSSCGSELRFNSSATSSLQSSIVQVGQWEKKFEESDSELKTSIAQVRQLEKKLQEIDRNLKTAMEKFKDALKNTMASTERVISKK